MQEITPSELQDYLAIADPPPLLLDVREALEYAICHIAGSRHIPMNQVPQALDDLNPEQEIIVICHHGMRSARVASYLQQVGFDKVLNLAGGIHAWACEVDPNMPTY
jgi:rhodanese-related sulfurtransferase